MAESMQKKVSRVRPPRVHIEYEVEIGDAIVMKELPFIVGVMADLSGKSDPNDPLKPLVERKFTDIDRDNFNEVLANTKPRVAFSVDNRLKNDETKIPVELRFKNIEDFEPEKVVKQIDPLAKLLEIRSQLSGLLTKADGNANLSRHLEEILKNAETQKKISDQEGLGKESTEGEGDPKGGAK
jgi:type VI secretion system protein ImpB